MNARDRRFLRRIVARCIDPRHLDIFEQIVGPSPTTCKLWLLSRKMQWYTCGCTICQKAGTASRRAVHLVNYKRKLEGEHNVFAKPAAIKVRLFGRYTGVITVG